MVNKPRTFGSGEAKNILDDGLHKYNEGIDHVLLMESVLDPPKASAVATLHPPILLVDTLHLVSQRAFSFVAN